jgi:hypothetical protein
MCYAVSENDGRSFGKTIQIPGSSNVKAHGENMPKIIVKPSGEIIAVWGTANPNPKNAYSGLVYYTQSFDSGNTWSKPAKLVNDTAGYDQRYFDLALLPDGEAAIVWLDNRINTIGSGLYYSVTKGKNGFQDGKLIAGPCCECCRTDLFADSRKNIHVVYRAIINDSIRDMVHIISTDNGHSFSNPLKISHDNWVINACPHTGPAITENIKGIHFAWFTAAGTAGIYYNRSYNNGKSFSSKNFVSGRTAKHSQITALPDNNIIVVWNEGVPGGGNRIGIEIRDQDGKKIVKQFITPENEQATYPVICPIRGDSVLIAYTETRQAKEFIYLRSISF